ATSVGGESSRASRRSAEAEFYSVQSIELHRARDRRLFSAGTNRPEHVHRVGEHGSDQGVGEIEFGREHRGAVDRAGGNRVGSAGGVVDGTEKIEEGVGDYLLAGASARVAGGDVY